MPLRGVFFDLYGTLLTYGDMRVAWDAWLATLHSGLERQGLTVARPALAALCDRFFERAEPAGEADGRTPLERRLRALCDDLGLRLDATVLRDIGEAAAEAWQRYVALDPEAGPLLRTLRRRYAVALVSNFDHPPHVHRVLSRYGLAEAFDAIVVSAEIGAKKPDPRIFEVALERTGVRPDEAVHVGDTDDDAQGASRAGIRPILIRRSGENAPEPPFDFRAEHVAHPRSVASKIDGVPVVTALTELRAILGV
jgi:putative hydrolase of the HAD superfamily